MLSLQNKEARRDGRPFPKYRPARGGRGGRRKAEPKKRALKQACGKSDIGKKSGARKLAPRRELLPITLSLCLFC